MTINQVTRGLVAGSIIGVVLTLIPAAVSAAGTPPPIEDIAAQYGTDTGATYISCSAYPEQTVCYGIGPAGAVIGARYADGAFTPIAAAAPTDDTATTTSTTPTTTAAPLQFEADGITSRIDTIAVVDPTAAGELSQGCQEEIDFRVEYYDEVPATQCVYVKWSFDVAADFGGGDDEGGLSPGSMLTIEGLQIDQATIATGMPGATNRSIFAYYAGGTRGSTLTFSTGSNEVGWTEHSLEVPAVDVMAEN